MFGDPTMNNGSFVYIVIENFSPTIIRGSLSFTGLGSLGHNSVQAGAFWAGYFLGEHLFLEKNIPDLSFLGLSNAIYMKLL